MPEGTASRLLARKGNPAWAVSLDLSDEPVDVEVGRTDLLVGARPGLADVREADSVVQDLRVLGRLQPPRRKPDLVKGRPKGVARSGVVGAQLRGFRPECRPAEDHAKSRADDVLDQHLPEARPPSSQRPRRSRSARR